MAGSCGRRRGKTKVDFGRLPAAVRSAAGEVPEALDRRPDEVRQGTIVLAPHPLIERDPKRRDRDFGGESGAGLADATRAERMREPRRPCRHLDQLTLLELGGLAQDALPTV